MIPAALHPNDTIGVLSPAGPLLDRKQDHCQTGLRYIEHTGYHVKTGQFLFSENGYLAGTDEERAYDLNRMLLDPQIKAVFCSRGGYGCARILDRLEWNRIAGTPKILLGSSDITVLQLALYRKLGWITFSGPMVAVDMHDLSPVTERSLWETLTGRAADDLSAGPAPHELPDFPGTARGPLLGGCLSVISAMIGTIYCPDFNGAVFLMEDVGENLYKIDRYFSQLQGAGILGRIAGVVLGTFVNIKPDESELADILEHYLSPLSIPVLTGFPYGHVREKYTLPLGCRVEIDAKHRTLKFLEKCVT